MSIGELKAKVFHSRQRPSLLMGDGILLLGDYFAAAFCAAQRFLTASAIRFRHSGEMFLFFIFAGFAATGATTASAFFFAAQRRFMASTMRFRPSGLSFLFLAGFTAAGAATATAFFGLVAFGGGGLSSNTGEFARLAQPVSANSFSKAA